jgi:hypothetical protein
MSLFFSLRKRLGPVLKSSTGRDNPPPVFAIRRVLDVFTYSRPAGAITQSAFAAFGGGVWERTPDAILDERGYARLVVGIRILYIPSERFSCPCERYIPCNCV